MRFFIFDNGLNLTNYTKMLDTLSYSYTLSTDISKSDNCDVLLLTGGKHVHPLFFSDKISYNFNIDIITDTIELILIDKFLSNNRKIIGICKGLQILNVYFNGTLKFVDNHLINDKDILHNVYTTDQNLVKLFGKNFIVNSCHTMKIDVLANNLTPTIFHKDGTIEGVKDENNNVYAFQFHPERLGQNFYSKLLIYLLVSFIQ